MLKRRIYGRVAIILSDVQTQKKFVSFFLLVTVMCFSIGLNAFLFKTTRAAAVTWVGGVDLDWCTDANWSSLAEPTSTDDVTVSSGA